MRYGRRIGTDVLVGMFIGTICLVIILFILHRTEERAISILYGFSEERLD